MAAMISKDEKKFLGALQTMKVLIADPTSSRKSFRALMSEFGFKPHQIDVVETVSEAKDFLKKGSNIVFADYSLGGTNCFEFVTMQQESLPASATRAFFLITSQDSNSLVSSAADESVDAIFVKPFTFGTLKERFREVMEQKIAPSPYTQSLNAGRAALRGNQLDDALKAFQEAKRLDPAPALACSYEGEVYVKLGDNERAIVAYEEGLSYNKTHFRSLLGIIECYMHIQQYEKAYAAGRKLIHHHTVPVKRIPELIRLSVLNQKFEDVVQFYEITSNLNEFDDTLSTFLGAGLVICGLYFLRKADNASALNAFHKAEVACKQQPRILTRILKALIAAGLESEMKAFLSRVPDEVKDSDEIRMAQLEYWAQAGSPHKALEEALKLIQQGIKHEKLYEMAIGISVQLKRKEAIIQDLVWRAVQSFPDRREHFEQLGGVKA